MFPSQWLLWIEGWHFLGHTRWTWFQICKRKSHNWPTIKLCRDFQIPRRTHDPSFQHKQIWPYQSRCLKVSHHGDIFVLEPSVPITLWVFGLLILFTASFHLWSQVLVVCHLLEPGADWLDLMVLDCFFLVINMHYRNTIGWKQKDLRLFLSVLVPWMKWTTSPSYYVAEYFGEIWCNWI